MNNGLQIFENTELGKIRLVGIDGEPWWVLADVCNVLDLSNSRVVSERLDDDEKGVSQIYTLGGVQNMTVVNEPGLYKVVLRSNKPAAKPFMQWMNEEVLPTIHKQDVPKSIAAEGLMALSYKGSSVRMQMIDGEPWWALPDVCSVLEISNSRDVASRLDADEKMTVDLTDGHSGMRGGAQRMTIVNEPGLYSVIMRSEKPEAKEFKRWVTHEVLPSIRKYGAYMTPEKIEEILFNPDTIINLATQLRDAQQQARALTLENGRLMQENAEMRPKAAFADAVSESESCILVGELAKILNQNGIDTGQNRLFGDLRGDGFLISRKGRDYNMPTQKSMEMGLFRIKETVATNSNGNTVISKTPLVTGKGQQYFVNKFLKDRMQ